MPVATLCPGVGLVVSIPVSACCRSTRYQLAYTILFSASFKPILLGDKGQAFTIHKHEKMVVYQKTFVIMFLN